MKAQKQFIPTRTYVNMDMEEDLAVGDILAIPVSLDDDAVIIPRGKGKATSIVVPHYDGIQSDR